MKKEIKGKIHSKPRLYWFHRAFLGWSFFLFLCWCTYMSEKLNWISRDYGIDIGFHATVFYIVTLLWIIILFCFFRYKKEVCHRKWLRQGLCVCILFFVLAIITQLVSYSNRPAYNQTDFKAISYGH